MPSSSPGRPQDGNEEQTPKATEKDASAKKKRSTLKKVVIDPVTELEDGPGMRFGRGGFSSGNQDVSEITTTVSEFPIFMGLSDLLPHSQHDFLPRSRTVMALLSIRADPLAHFMPTITNERGSFFCAAPPGLPPQLTSLFMFPVRSPHKSRRERATDTDGEGRSPKRARMGTDDVEAEVGLRHGSVARSDVFGRGGDISFGADMGVDDFPMDFDGGANGMDVASAVEEARLRASKLKIGSHGQAGAQSSPDHADDDRRSRYSSPGDGLGEEDVTFSDLVCPIASFDMRPTKDSQAPVAAQEEEEEGPNSDNYSKQTVKAINLLKRQIRTSQQGATPTRARAAKTDNTLSFAKLSEKVCGMVDRSICKSEIVLCRQLDEPQHPSSSSS